MKGWCISCLCFMPPATLHLTEKTMNQKLILLAALTLMSGAPLHPELPYVYDRENMADSLPRLSFPSFEELPDVPALPDPFINAFTGQRTEDFKEWEMIRSGILQNIMHYETGEKPTTNKENVKADVVNDTIIVTIREGEETLTLHSPIVYPSECAAPFPVVIGIGLPTGSLPPELFLGNGIAAIPFNFTEVMSHTQQRGSEPINRLYPDKLEIGAYAAWAWGISRLIDGLELVADKIQIDLSHIAVTGCSFAGKMALFAGAMDQRIALTIAQEPGGGGVNAWRVSETLGNVEKIGNTNYAWFLESMRQFAGDSVSKLPTDHHQLTALIAPRALLIIGNTDYEWLAEESGYVSAKAAREVWSVFGVADRMGYTVEGGHFHCQLPDSQYPEVEAFIKRFLLGEKNVDTNITRAPMFDQVKVNKWAPWIKNF